MSALPGSSGRSFRWIPGQSRARSSPWPTPCRWSSLDCRRSVNLLDTFGQRCIEFGIAHGMPEIINQSPRKARDHAVIGGEALAGNIPCVAARERYDPNDAVGLDQWQVEIRNFWDRQLEHDLAVASQALQPLSQFRAEGRLGFGVVKAPESG